MASWSEFQDAVRAAYPLDRDDPDALAVTLQHGARAQRVMVRHHTALDVELVEFRSAFSEAKALGSRDFLEGNLTLPIGAVAKHGRFLVVVQKTVLAHTSIEGLLFLLTQVSMLADALEQRDGTDRF